MMTRMRDRGSDTSRCSAPLSLPTAASAIFAAFPRGGRRTLRERPRSGRCGRAARCSVGVVVPERRARGGRQPPFRGRTTSPEMPRAARARRGGRQCEEGRRAGAPGAEGGGPGRGRGSRRGREEVSCRYGPHQGARKVSASGLSFTASVPSLPRPGTANPAGSKSSAVRVPAFWGGSTK